MYLFSCVLLLSQMYGFLKKVVLDFLELNTTSTLPAVSIAPGKLQSFCEFSLNHGMNKWIDLKLKISGILV